jgi:hypothetical protein
LIIDGKNSIGVCLGRNSKIGGIRGSLIALVEYDMDGIPINFKTAKIDGKKIKANTFYKLVDGEFKEVK